MTKQPFSKIVREVIEHQHDLLTARDITERVSGWQQALDDIGKQDEIKNNPELATKARLAGHLLGQLAKQTDSKIRAELIKGLINRMN